MRIGDLAEPTGTRRGTARASASTWRAGAVTAPSPRFPAFEASMSKASRPLARARRRPPSPYSNARMCLAGAICFAS